VDQGEDGCGRTNAERQSQNGRGSENRGVGELPQRVTDVSRELPFLPLLKRIGRSVG
jgi:hypothetical protein